MAEFETDCIFGYDWSRREASCLRAGFVGDECHSDERFQIED